MPSSRLDGEITSTTVRRSSAGRGRSPSVPPQQKPEHSSGDAASLSSSPLKGIGHTSLPMPATFIPSFSLPLMGIGNRQGVLRPRVRDRHRVSLPLMRIGTHDQALRPRLLILDLITPHGDRKPAWRRRRAMPAPSRPPHYPSWGSETCTTHGTRRATSSSLPLMGIGNVHPGSPDGSRRANQLITPHGDRKLAGRRSGPRHDASRPRSHYPSWGSETPVDQPAAGAGRDLITPHGDRKRPPAPSGGSRCPASLPLMGIGNLRSAAPPP